MIYKTNLSCNIDGSINLNDFITVRQHLISTLALDCKYIAISNILDIELKSVSGYIKGYYFYEYNIVLNSKKLKYDEIIIASTKNEIYNWERLLKLKELFNYANS